MSLKAFHLVFCATVFGFFLYFGLWCFEEYSASSSIGYLLTGIGSFASGVFTPFYITWFLKKLRGVGFVALFFALMAEKASACPVCVGDPNHPMVRSANNGVLFLLAVTAAILIPMAAVFIYWGYRSHQQSKLEIY